jgi:hypothetical protein
MAYWVAQAQADGANSTFSTYSVDMPAELVSGDLIVCYMSTRGTAAITPPTGYTLVNAANPTTKTGDDYDYLAYKIADGTESIATFSLTSGSSNMCISVDIFRDTGGVVATAEAHDNSTSTTKTFPDVTPTSSDDLWIGCMGIDTNSKSMLMDRQTGVPYPYDAPVVSGYTYTRRTVNLSYCQLNDTTAIGSSFVTQHESDQTSLFSLIISNSASGLTPPQVQMEKSWFQPFGGLTSNPTYTNPTWTSLHSSVSTIDGDTVVDASLNLPSGASNSNLDNSLPTQNFRRISFGNFGTAEDDWQGATIPVAIDLSGGKVFQSTFSEPNPQRSKQNGYIFIDSGGNWSVFTIKTANIDSGKGDNIIIVSENSAPRYSSSTACDMTDITKVGILCRASNLSNNTVLLPYMQVVDKITFLGINPSRFHELGTLDRSKYIDGSVSLQGFTQTQWRMSAQVGDGSIETFIDLSTSSVEFQGQDGVTNFVNAEDLALTLKLSASDTFNNGAITASSGIFNYTLDPTTSSSATYNFDNTTILNSVVTWDTDIPINAQNFIGCGVIDAKGATFTNCNISKSQSTTHAMTVAAGASVTGCSFIQLSETYAIEIPSAGTYDLSDTSFSGYTNELNVTETSGTVTINLALGQVEPTYITAGATVTFVQPTVTYQVLVPNIIDGSVYQVKNITTATELTYGTVSGGAGIDNTYTKDTDYTAGDSGRLRVVYHSGTTAKEEIEIDFTFAAATTINSLPNTQSDKDEYNTYAVDGSTITEFIFDSPNLEVDISDADNSTAIQRIGSWYYYYITTTTGIDELFGCLDWESLNSIKIDQSMCDLKIDNTKATPLLLQGGRLYRVDGSTIIASTSNSIQIDFSPVYVTSADPDNIADLVWNDTTPRPNGSKGQRLDNIPKIIARNDEL